MTPGASRACHSLGHTLFVRLVPGPGLTHLRLPADPRTLPVALWQAPEPELRVPVKGFQETCTQSSNPAFRALTELLPKFLLEPEEQVSGPQFFLCCLRWLLSGPGTLLSKRLCNHPGGKKGRECPHVTS